MEYSTITEAAKKIKSGDNIFIHGVACVPQRVVEAMVARKSELKGVNIFQLHSEGYAPYAEPDCAESFAINAFFIGKNVRRAIQEGRGSYIPIFLSEIPGLFRNEVIPLDVALISVSPADKHGYYSLGLSVDAAKAAVEKATIVIAQVNRFMPRILGDGIIHESDIDVLVEHDSPIPEIMPPTMTPAELAIGKHVADLIEDRSTLQLGIGAIPNAVLSALGNHKDLGIHTEMFSDGVISLIESGVINGKYKKIEPGKIVSSFVMGTRELYDFLDDNPMVELLDCSFVNDTHIIRQNPKTVAINSAIEIDLTGQVCADSIGKSMYSGVGGQMDFIRGASLSKGGKPIIALKSITNTGISRITPYLKEGAGVVTTRAHIQYVVTEFGVANLYGKTLKQRSKLLINIAHPEHREELERQTFTMFKGH